MSEIDPAAAATNADAAAAPWLRARTRLRPRVGVVLGSGLGAWARSAAGAEVFPYGDIPGMPVSQVPGHAGELVLRADPAPGVAILAGRVHAYESGRTPAQLHAATRGVRLLRSLGAETVVFTNAAGTLHEEWSAGDLALISDHINFIGTPLLGPQFVDLSQAYDPALRTLARAAADVCGERLREGVYAAVPGPNYETPAEIRALRRIGADLVGMSTAPEVIAARAAGLRVLAISVVTNHAAGLQVESLSHAEVLATGATASQRLGRLLDTILPRLVA